MVANFAKSLELNYQKMKELKKPIGQKSTAKDLKKLKHYHQGTKDNHIKKIQKDVIYDKGAHLE